MGVLLKVLGKAGPSVLIFSIVAMVPSIGLSLSYHVAFGAQIKNYSTLSLSLNTLSTFLRFDEESLHSINDARGCDL